MAYLVADALHLPLRDDLQLLQHDEVLIDVVHQIENIYFGRLLVLVINRKRKVGGGEG